MIHHCSISARDPAKVANVLAELTGWDVRPFLGPVADAFVVLSGDQFGSAIEVYPDKVVMAPGHGDVQCTFGHDEGYARTPFHILLSADTDVETILKIGAREGWHTLHCWRGPPDNPVFELVELWLENRIMVEVATPDMLPNYVRAHTIQAHDAAIAAMGGAPDRNRADFKERVASA